MTSRTIRIGTRGSRLALTQTRSILRALKARFPRDRFSVVVIKTRGDEFQGVELFKRSGTGVFTKALERALLGSRIDIAVHSLKDLPVDLAKGLVLGAFPRREDARDALITCGTKSIAQLPAGAVVGTGSPRRKAQLLRVRPDLRLVDMRGNLDTRVRRVLHEKKYDAIVVALAGLRRIGRYLRYARPVPPDVLMPAVAQAALGIQVRSGDSDILRRVSRLDHKPTACAVTAERALLKALHGGCRVPVGVVSRIRSGRIFLRARVFSLDGQRCLEAAAEGSCLYPERLAKSLAVKLLRQGARRFLREARSA